MHAGLVIIGEQLGLYKGPRERERPAHAHRAGGKTGTTERYVLEWLNAQAAGGYVTYDADDGRYSLSPEQAFTLANEDSPVYIPCAFQAATAALKSTPKINAGERPQSVGRMSSRL